MEGPRPAETGEDPLAPYRGRILYGLASAAAVCLLPFSVNAFVQGNPWLGAGILCAFLVLGIDALAIYLKKSPPIPLILLLVPITVGTAVSLKVQGFFGALWAYPTVLLFTFSLSRRTANAGNILLLLIISALVYHYIDVAYTIRFIVTLTLTIILANIVLSIIVDLHRRLLDQALVDPLTGVFNRRYMERCLSDAIEHGCFDPLVSITMQMIGSERIDGDDYQVHRLQRLSGVSRAVHGSFTADKNKHQYGAE